MPHPEHPIAVVAAEVAVRTKPTIYPPPFASRVAGREKRVLGDLFGLRNFGVNLTRLSPRAISSLRHCHAKQDEFLYVLEGRPTLRTDEGDTQLAPGMCAGFRGGSGNAHQLVNETGEDVVFLEIGDRTQDEEVVYPDDDLQLATIGGRHVPAHKDGTPY